MDHVPPWDPDEAGPVYVYVRLADHLAARIAAGEITSRLPGESALSSEYGVALGTVRRALDVLRERGLVITLPAKGTYVVPPGDR